MYCTFFLNVYTVLNSVGEPSISKTKDQCCGLSSYFSLLSPATCTNTQVETFDGDTTPNISL